MNAPANTGERRRLLRYHRDEVAAALLYDVMAQREKDPERSSIFRDLAFVERRHAKVWAEKLADAGIRIPTRPSFKARLLPCLAKVLGTRRMLPILSAAELKARNEYSGQEDAEALGMPAEERTHAKVFSEMASSETSRPRPELWHRSSTGGGLRAAVFGVSDGLVSNFSLIMGVAGGTAERPVILLAGMAGMLAGAFSMASGEYISVRSQRELFEREIEREREEVRENPEEEAEELALIYRAKGIPADQARDLAKSLMKDSESALNTLAKEELGLDPSELGSPWVAAGSSFFAFVGGALVPLLPFLFRAGPSAVWLSAGLSAAALFAVGAAIALFTGRGALYSGARLLLIGSAVALATNLIGRLLGVSLS